MTKNEITQKLAASGQFTTVHNAEQYRFPIDWNIVIVPVRSQEQLDFCEKLGLQVFKEMAELPNGEVRQTLVIAGDFETIAKAIAYKQD